MINVSLTITNFRVQPHHTGVNKFIRVNKPFIYEYPFFEWVAETLKHDRLPGVRLNKKDSLTRYGNSHVKDKTS